MMRRYMEAPPLLVKVNLTPVIDVALVLVIILLVTAPMLSVSEIDLELPEARTQAMEDEHRVNVTIGGDGRVSIDETIVPRETLVRGLSLRLVEEGKDEALVVVRADAGLPHGVVRGLIDDTRAAGAVRIAFATIPPKQGVAE